ncbi:MULTISPECIES: hypothetical protein [unclassified Paraflavitalea]|uniref:hypothetical protein n=1 Tax=unclassified Paraflavitalea TaxID=2798305 RepID=UPI003D34D8B2
MHYITISTIANCELENNQTIRIDKSQIIGYLPTSNEIPYFTPKLHYIMGRARLDTIHNNIVYSSILISKETNGPYQVADYCYKIQNSVFDFLWYIKDHSIESTIQFCYSKDLTKFVESINGVNYCDSTCEFKSTTINQEEINKAIEIMNLYRKYDSNPYKPIQNNFEYKKIFNSSLDFNKYDLTKLNRLERTHITLKNARKSMIITMKIALYCSVLEHLFNYNHKKITESISTSTANYIALSQQEANEIKKIVREGYKIRSNFVHGRKQKYTQHSEYAEISNKLDDYIRRCFHLIYNGHIDLLNTDQLLSVVKNKF